MNADIQRNKIDSLEKKILKLEYHQEFLNSALQINKQGYENKIDQEVARLRKENRTVEFLGSIIIFIGIGAIVYAIYTVSVSFKKNLKDREQVLINRFVTQFDELAETNRIAFLKLLQTSNIELDLMKKYTIHILFNGKDIDRREMLCEMLQCFGFKCTSLDFGDLSTLGKFDVLFFYDDTNIKIEESYQGKPSNFSKWLNQQLSNLATNSINTPVSFFFLNMHGLQHNFKNFSLESYSSATSYANIYGNLISLLHYKRYLNNQN